VLPIRAQDPASSGQRAYEQENYQEAILYFQQAITQQPHVSHYVNLGHCYFHLEMWPSAIEAYQEALTRDDGVATAAIYRALGQACFRAERYDRAMEALQQARTLEPNSRDGLWVAKAFMAQRRWVSARAILCRQLDLVPGQEEALALLAETYAHTMDWKQAALIYGELVALAPENSAYRLGYAQTQAQAGDYQAAHDTLDVALRLDPECQIQAQRLLADLQLAQDLPREAAFCYARLLHRLDDPTAEDLYRLGTAYLQNGELASAARCFTRLQTLDARDVRAPRSLGQIRALQGQTAAARTQYEAALVLQPESGPLHLALAILADRQRDPALAAQHYHRAIDLGERSLEVFVQAITAARHAQQNQRTLDLLKRGLLHFPRSQQLLDQLDLLIITP
jgi:tetratricopeptide (TPR) repeat protein